MRKMRLVTMIIVVVSLLAGTALAVRNNLPNDSLGRVPAGGAFIDPAKSAPLLTVNHTVKEVSDDIQWTLYTPTACKFRVQSTATKAGRWSTAPVNTRVTVSVAKNRAKNFVNFSGCTNAEFDKY